MSRAATIVLVLSLALGVFSAWGMLTAAGQARFDEMDGMIPVAAGAMALLGCTIAALLLSLARRHKVLHRRGFAVITPPAAWERGESFPAGAGHASRELDKPVDRTQNRTRSVGQAARPSEPGA